MSACCRGWAFTGTHDEACAEGKAASQAAPEHVGPPAAVPQLTADQKEAVAAQLKKLQQEFETARRAASPNTAA
jgi:hypothetical protein